jgi:hypothetical protein
VRESKEKITREGGDFQNCSELVSVYKTAQTYFGTKL